MSTELKVAPPPASTRNLVQVLPRFCWLDCWLYVPELTAGCILLIVLARDGRGRRWCNCEEATMYVQDVRVKSEPCEVWTTRASVDAEVT